MSGWPIWSGGSPRLLNCPATLAPWTARPSGPRRWLLPHRVVPRGTSAPDLTNYAERLIPWIIQLPAVRLDVTLFLDGRLIAHSSNGGDMAFSATPGVNQKFDVTVTAEGRRGEHDR